MHKGDFQEMEEMKVFYEMLSECISQPYGGPSEPV